MSDETGYPDKGYGELGHGDVGYTEPEVRDLGSLSEVTLAHHGHHYMDGNYPAGKPQRSHTS